MKLSNSQQKVLTDVLPILSLYNLRIGRCHPCSTPEPSQRARSLLESHLQGLCLAADRSPPFRGLQFLARPHLNDACKSHFLLEIHHLQPSVLRVQRPPKRCRVAVREEAYLGTLTSDRKALLRNPHILLLLETFSESPSHRHRHRHRHHALCRRRRHHLHLAHP